MLMENLLILITVKPCSCKCVNDGAVKNPLVNISWVNRSFMPGSTKINLLRSENKPKKKVCYNKLNALIT